MLEYNTTQQLFKLFVNWSQYRISFPSGVSELAGKLNDVCSKMSKLASGIPNQPVIERQIVSMRQKLTAKNFTRQGVDFNVTNLDRNQELLTDILKESTQPSNLSLIKVQKQTIEERRANMINNLKYEYRDIKQEPTLTAFTAVVNQFFDTKL